VPLVQRWSELRFMRGLQPPPADWTEPDFDDSGWELGYLYMGYGFQQLSTPIDDLQDAYTTVYLRHHVDLGPGAPLYGRLWFDGASSGGYALSVNGVELAREGLAKEAAHDQPADGDAPPQVPVDLPPGLLTERGNVVTVEIHRPDPAPLSYLVYSQVLGEQNGDALPPMIVRGPYQQDLRPDGVTLVFQTSAPVAAVVTCGPRQRRWTSPASTSHSVRLEGLSPSQLQHWQIDLGRGVAATGSFTTAPLGDEPFTFLAYGDTRTTPEVHAGLVERMKDEPADFALHVGDFVWLGAADIPWDGFFAVADPLLRRLPLYPTLGNHEAWLDPLALQYSALWVVPANGPPDQGKRAYSFRHGSSLFVVLNSSADGHTFNWGTQPEWLSRVLDQASADRTVRHIFVALHVPVIGSSPYGPAPGADRILSVLSRHRIALLMQGHDHLYERGEINGLRYLTTGGGGGPLTALETTQKMAGSQVLESEYHYVRIDVSGAAVHVTARRLDGTVLDDVRFVDE
jgi:hypothetical protein